MAFDKSAGQSGGCIYATGGIDFLGEAEFRQCAAVGDGGAVAAHHVASHAQLAFHECTSGGGGTIINSMGNARTRLFLNAK